MNVSMNRLIAARLQHPHIVALFAERPVLAGPKTQILDRSLPRRFIPGDDS